MDNRTLKTGFRRRKEAILLACAVAVCLLVAMSSLTGWLKDEIWGGPITMQRGSASGAPPAVDSPDFAAAWDGGGRNPFGDASETLDSGGKANIPLPPLPPLIPQVPSAPMPRPIDFLTEGGQ
jgi:hypothetical protein